MNSRCRQICVMGVVLLCTHAVIPSRAEPVVRPPLVPPEIPWVVSGSRMDETIRPDLTDKVVLLVFFRMGDELAVEALKQAERLWRAFSHRGLVVLGVHIPPKGWHPPPAYQVLPDRKDKRIRKDDSVKPKYKSKRNRRKPPRGKSYIETLARDRYLTPLNSLVEQLKLRFPILLDFNQVLWNRYRLVAYPGFEVVSRDGQRTGKFIGTGAYSAMSRQIRRLLKRK